MKKIFNYISALILVALAFTSCKDNDNWVIIEEAQPGTYIVGSATIFSGEASTSALKPVKLDIGDGESETKPDIIGIYTWLKSGADFNISVCTVAGEAPVKYGKGEVVEEEADVISIYNLSETGPAFTVSADGLYNVIVNTTLNQVSILPVSWGIIGAATAQAWNGETPFNAPKFDSASNTVEWEMSTTLSAGEFKFRYSGNWGYEIPYDAAGTKVKIFTDVTGTQSGTDNILTEGYTTMETGGANLVTNIGGQFSVFMKYDIRAGQFSARYVLTGDPIIPPTYPEKLFIVGDAFNGWTPETDAEECIPVNGTPGSFWKIAYLNKGGFKFTVKLGWGGDFGIAEQNNDAIGEYSKGGNNINVTTPGYYLIYVDLEKNTISLTDVNIYLFGDTNGGQWEYADANKFTVDNAAKKIISPVFAADGNLRMCIKHPDLSDWWKAEFNVYNGKIEYRADGGDQASVPVKAGQKVELDFTNGTGIIQ